VLIEHHNQPAYLLSGLFLLLQFGSAHVIQPAYKSENNYLPQKMEICGRLTEQAF